MSLFPRNHPCLATGAGVVRRIFGYSDVSLIFGAVGYAPTTLQYTVHQPAQLHAPQSAALTTGIIDIDGWHLFIAIYS